MLNLPINNLSTSSIMQRPYWYTPTINQNQQSTTLSEHSRSAKCTEMTVCSSTEQLINEVDYDSDHPWLAQQQVLPLLWQTIQQSRWQLWLTAGQKLDRRWLQSAGLPISKMLLMRQLNSSQIVDNMINALQTGNYSVVIGCLPEVAKPQQYEKLVTAAQTGNSIALLIHPQAITQHVNTTQRGHHHWYH